MPYLRALVDQGLVYEDQFIETYFKVLRDEGFMDLFGGHLDEAKMLLTTMIDESKLHRADLETLKNALD